MINFSKNQKEIIKVFHVEKFLKICLAFDIFYAFLMLANDVIFLFLIYFLLACLLLYSLVFAKMDNFNACVFSVFFCSFCFSFFSVLFLGWGYGFEYYVIPLIAYCYFGVYSKKYIIYLIGLFGLFCFLLMYYFFVINDFSFKINLYYFDDNNRFYFNAFNATFLASLFVFASNVLRMQIREEIKTRQMQNIKIDNATYFDDLTKLLSRYSLDNKLVELNMKSDVNLALIDIDCFKNINDTYGHNIGDKVLKISSELIKKNFNTYTDKLIRWGGEEFLVIAAEIELNEFYQICENFRKDYEEYDFKLPDLNSTVSIGVVCVNNNFASNILDEYMRKVDKCLHEAKISGGNKTIKKII